MRILHYRLLNGWKRSVKLMFSFWIRNWFHIATHPDVLLLLLVLFVGRPSSKSLRLRRFKADRNEILQDYYSSKFASIDGVGFLIWHQTFKMAAITSFHVRPSLDHWLPDSPPNACEISFWSIVHSYSLLSMETAAVQRNVMTKNRLEDL